MFSSYFFARTGEDVHDGFEDFLLSILENLNVPMGDTCHNFKLGLLVMWAVWWANHIRSIRILDTVIILNFEGMKKHFRSYWSY